MTTVTIIGGGIAGLVCAALAQARGLGVTVIEGAPAVGGIWRSTEVRLGGHRLYLDAGLRLPVATGDAALDDPIFFRPDFRFDWTRFDDWPRESAITAGSFNPESSCLDATVLGEATRAVIAEMRGAGDDRRTESALDNAIGWYGPTLTNGLVRDAVMGLFETDLPDLAPNAVHWFVPRRVVLGDHEATERLLSDPLLTGRVAHARHVDLPRGIHRPFLRPRTGGISTWITALQASLTRAGVTFVLGDPVQAVHLAADGQQCDALTLRSGRTIRCDRVIGTVAPALLAQAAGMGTGSLPRFRHLRISHLLVDRAPAHRASYCLNFNRRPAFLRAIFHDNLPEPMPGAHVLTFEHLVGDGAKADLAAEALAECTQSGAVPAGTRLLATSTDMYRNIVPVPTLAHAKATAALRRDHLDRVANLRFVGRAAGGAPFLDQIIREADMAIAVAAEAPCHA